MSTVEGGNVVIDAPDQPDGGITTFIDDTIGKVSQPDLPNVYSTSILALSKIAGNDGIAEFLARPSRLASGSLSATDSTKLCEVDPFYGQIIGMKADKLKGVGLFRADILLRLEINAVRFQAGRYILAWFPSGGTYTNAFDAAYRSHTLNLQTITQLPHVEIDLAKETHVTLRIPFTSDRAYLNPTKLSPSFYGYAFLVPYVALIPGSSDSTCSYTLWASFENVHLSAPAIPQSSFQVKSTTRKEQDSAGTGPISSVAAKISKTASVLGMVPYFSSAMQGVSWMAELTAQAAKAWGYSKPAVLSQPQRVVREVFPYMANADNGTTGTPIALISTNEVPVANPQALTNVDEMSFDFIKRQWAYAGQFVWSTSDAADTSILAVGHKHDFFTSNGKGFSCAPISFLATQFEYWRGSIKFRFKLVKTEFHSGRLLVSYSPYMLGVPSWTIANTEYLYREIIDIRDTSEFEVTVPYVQDVAWSRTDGSFVGLLRIYVLDPLIAPSTVSASVPIVYEVAGGDDFDLAFPIHTPLQPWVPAVPMGGPDVYQTAKKVDLGTTAHSDVANLAIGEKVNSSRQLLKRSTVTFGTLHGVSATVAAGADGGVGVRPFAVGVAGQDIAAGNNSTLYRSTIPDLYSLWAFCYFFSSGSVNIKACLGVSSLSDTIGVTMESAANWNTGIIMTGAKASGSQNRRVMVADAVDPRIDVIVPQYHTRFARINHNFMMGTAWGATPAIHPTREEGGAVAIVHIDTFRNDYTRDWYIHRPIADDFSFSHWLGVPAVTLEDR